VVTGTLFSTGSSGGAAYQPAWYRSTYNPPNFAQCGGPNGPNGCTEQHAMLVLMRRLSRRLQVPAEKSRRAAKRQTLLGSTLPWTKVVAVTKKSSLLSNCFHFLFPNCFLGARHFVLIAYTNAGDLRRRDGRQWLDPALWRIVKDTGYGVAPASLRADGTLRHFDFG